MKVESEEELRKLLAEGWTPGKGKKGWWMYKPPGAPDTPEYNPRYVHAHIVKAFPEILKEDQQGAVSVFSEYEVEELKAHQPAIDLLRGVITLEQLYLKEPGERVDLALGMMEQVGKVDDSVSVQLRDTATNMLIRSGFIRLSLMDLAIYKLIETYLKWKQVEEDIEALAMINKQLADRINSVENLKSELLINYMMRKGMVIAR